MSRSQFKCPFCGQINEGDASLVNTKSQCVSCGNIFLLTPLKNEISKESAKFWYFYHNCTLYPAIRETLSKKEFQSFISSAFTFREKFNFPAPK